MQAAWQAQGQGDGCVFCAAFLCCAGATRDKHQSKELWQLLVAVSQVHCGAATLLWSAAAAVAAQCYVVMIKEVLAGARFG